MAGANSAVTAVTPDSFSEVQRLSPAVHCELVVKKGLLCKLTSPIPTFPVNPCLCQNRTM